VLGHRQSAAAGTLNEDGSIHLAYVILLYEDGRLYLEAASVTRKARNAAARPQGAQCGGAPASEQVWQVTTTPGYRTELSASFQNWPPI
jgi:hypothetical protein